MSSESEPLAASKRAGKNAEAAVVETVDGLEPIAGQDHYDAVAETAILPTRRCPQVGICVVEKGLPVEIKSAMAVYGAGQRRGRFKLRRTQHTELLETGGVYLFVVCEPTPAREPIALKIVPATIVDDLVETVASWRDEGDHRGPKTQIAWSRIFDPTEVE